MFWITKDLLLIFWKEKAPALQSFTTFLLMGWGIEVQDQYVHLQLSKYLFAYNLQI